MPAFNYGFKLDPMSGEMRYQPILNKTTSSSTTQNNWSQPQTTGYSPYGQFQQTDQFNMSSFGYPTQNTGYNGFGAVSNNGYNGFNAPTGGYTNTGFPQSSGGQNSFDPFAGVNPTLLSAVRGSGGQGYQNTGYPQAQGGAFGGGYNNVQGPTTTFGSSQALTASNNATFNNLLSSMPGSLGALQGLDLPGVFGGGSLTNAVAQQGYSLDGGNPFAQNTSVAANPWMAPAGYNTASTVGYAQPGQYNFNQAASGQPQTQYYNSGAFAQNYQSPVNTYQYPMTQTAQGYYGQPSQAFGYQPSPFQSPGYQAPQVGYTQYANAQPYSQQPGAFARQGTYPQQSLQTSAASVGGFANTPLGQASAGYAGLGDVNSLLAKADRNVMSAQNISDLLDSNKLSSSIKNTTQTLNSSLDAQKNWSAQDVLALSFNMNDILGSLNL